MFFLILIIKLNCFGPCWKCVDVFSSYMCTLVICSTLILVMSVCNDNVNVKIIKEPRTWHILVWVHLYEMQRAVYEGPCEAIHVNLNTGSSCSSSHVSGTNGNLKKCECVNSGHETG